MRTIFLTLTFAALVGGCATKEGFKLPSGSGPTKESAEDFNRRNSAAPLPVPSAELPRDTVKTALIPDVDGPRMIIIGNVMALTVFDDAALGSRYDNYLKPIQARGATPGFTREWYLATSAGETAVKFSGVTGIYSRFFKAEIPKDLIRQISFASAFGTFMAGTSGDLVAAERSAKNGTWVTRLLCSEKSKDYGTCEAQFARGIYQAVDGREIDDKLQLVASGQTIDPSTYRISTGVRAIQPTPAPVAPVAPVDATPRAVTSPATPAPSTAVAPVSQAPAQAAPSAQAKDATKQMEKLNELRAKGLITEAEYQKKRQEILESL